MSLFWLFFIVGVSGAMIGFSAVCMAVMRVGAPDQRETFLDVREGVRTIGGCLCLVLAGTMLSAACAFVIQ